MRTAIRVMILAWVFLAASPVQADPGTTKVTWHGHAAFEIVTPKGTVLMIDPWLNNPKNPKAGEKKDPLAGFSRVDYIILTHGHFDHVGDSVALAKKTGARLVTNFELGTNMAKVLGFPSDQMGFDTLMNIGGEIAIADGEVRLSLTPAVHSSGMNNPFAKNKEKEPDLVYGGNPAGVVLKIQDGPTIYHTGDTAYFLDMKVIGEVHRPDLALINIGGHFGMEPSLAARAAKTVDAKIAVPHHFATFPVLTQSAQGFAEALQGSGVKFVEMQPGSSLTFEGRELAD